MYNLKNLLNMPVLSLFEGELVGYVTNINFDKKLKRILSLSITDENELKYFIDKKNIYKIGKNAVTIKNNGCMLLELNNYTEQMSSPVNVKVYTIHGEYVGKVGEVLLSDKLLTHSIILEDSSVLDMQKIASCSKSTVILYDENSNVKVSRFRHKNPKTFKTKKVSMVSTQPIEPLEDRPVIETTPRVKSNSQFLLGRITTKDIFLNNKQILIKNNSTITSQIVSKAIINNKIKELMIYSKLN